MTKANTARDALAELRGDIDAVRDRIGDLVAERAETERAPVARAEAEERVAALIRGAQAADIFARPQLFAADGGADPYLNRVLAERPLEALAAVCPDQLAQAFLKHLPAGGISSDARLAKLERIDRDLRAAELAEEIAICELEALTGASVPRRLEASPEIILAPTEELEGGQ